MIKETVFLGVAGIILGIGIIVKQHSIFVALIPIVVGAALIIFPGEEDRLEKRRDKK